MVSSRLTRVVRAFDHWISFQDVVAARQASSIATWIANFVLVSLIVLLVAYAPIVRDFFALNPLVAMLAFLPAFLNGVVFSYLHRNNRPFTRISWVLFLLGVVLLHFFCAMLVALSAINGAILFASFLLFTMAFHGHLFRVTPRLPFVPIASGVALLTAASFSRTPQHLILFAVAGTGGLVAMVLVGMVALRSDEKRRENENLRVALSAQELDQKSKEIERLSEMLLEMLGTNHDLNNALATALLNVHQLEFAVSGSPAGAVPVAEVETATHHIGKSLGRIREMVHSLQERARTSRVVPLQGVELRSVLPPLLRELQLRHPGTQITLHQPPSIIERPLVRGGSMTLQRIIENLVINACEGSGKEGARSVAVHVRLHERTGRLEISVEDDGPGFRKEQLAKAVARFETTKRTGTGLGLYTCERLIQASHGSLLRSNRVEGGAVATVFFSLEKT